MSSVDQIRKTIYMSRISPSHQTLGYFQKQILQLCVSVMTRSLHTKNVTIPLIAHGGAGNFDHVYELIKKTNISGVSISSLFHYDLLGKFNFDKSSVGNTDFLNKNRKRKIKNNLKILKEFLYKKNIKVRK